MARHTIGRAREVLPPLDQARIRKLRRHSRRSSDAAGGEAREISLWPASEIQRSGTHYHPQSDDRNNKNNRDNHIENGASNRTPFGKSRHWHIPVRLASSP
jgi:hypothetical protein